MGVAAVCIEPATDGAGECCCAMLCTADMRAVCPEISGLIADATVVATMFAMSAYAAEEAPIMLDNGGVAATLPRFSSTAPRGGSNPEGKVAGNDLSAFVDEDALLDASSVLPPSPFGGESSPPPPAATSNSGAAGTGV